MKSYMHTENPTDPKLKGQSSSGRQGTNQAEGLQLPHPSKRVFVLVSAVEQQVWEEHTAAGHSNDTRTLNT